MQPYQQPYQQPFANPYVGQGAQPYAVDMPAVMRTVYLWLAIGLAVGFGVAYWLGNLMLAALPTYQAGGYLPPLEQALFSPITMIVALIAYFVVGFGFYPIVRRTSPTAGAVMYLAFAVVFGILITPIFVAYTSSSIASAFAITAGMFAIMSLIGYTTRLDLSKLGAILFMALIGIIIASVVNFFLQSQALYWIVTYAVIVVFSGLTAYDTQWIRKQSAALVKVNDGSALARLALVGAFKLFLDFINLFLAILRITGRARN
ncbi:MAG TPA: Bax inhibitor-1/YccA family protein [Ktedonobacterales bacterium]|jgi:hypothetical protein